MKKIISDIITSDPVKKAVITGAIKFGTAIFDNLYKISYILVNTYIDLRKEEKEAKSKKKV